MRCNAHWPAPGTGKGIRGQQSVFADGTPRRAHALPDHRVGATGGDPPVRADDVVLGPERGRSQRLLRGSWRALVANGRRYSRVSDYGHPAADRSTFGWASLTDAELRVAGRAACGLTSLPSIAESRRRTQPLRPGPQELGMCRQRPCASFGPTGPKGPPCGPQEPGELVRGRYAACTDVEDSTFKGCVRRGRGPGWGVFVTTVLSRRQTWPRP